MLGAAVGDLAGTVTYNGSQTNTWTRFPVTGMVRDWVAGTRPNYGFMLKAANETLATGGPMFSAGAEAPRRGARPALPSPCQSLPLDRNSARGARWLREDSHLGNS